MTASITVCCATMGGRPRNGESATPCLRDSFHGTRLASRIMSVTALRVARMRLQSSTVSTRDLLGQFMTTPWVAERMVDAVTVPAPWRILDPACGDGNLLVAAVQHALHHGIEVEAIVGYDVDGDMLSVALERLSAFVEADKLELHNGDFLTASHAALDDINVVLANPPYGRGREYRFFEHCAELLQKAELIFLVPLAFVDRVAGVSATPISGRPLGVTTGHAIAVLQPGQSYTIRSTRERIPESGDFRVLTGAKLYEKGAGVPPQSESVIQSRAYSSSVEKPGWLPCARTGDVRPDGVVLDRLWVNYGKHLAHPKDISRFTGPRLFVRRVPIWKQRQLGAAYIDTPAVAAGDLLVVKHIEDDEGALIALRDYINSPEGAAIMHVRRPSVALRDSFPKFSSKDLTWLIKTFERAS